MYLHLTKDKHSLSCFISSLHLSILCNNYHPHHQTPSTTNRTTTTPTTIST
uniref:Uncharacterized protein n=1 Tax=Helianthus annuus TaxID=4232 RepID=A0A251V4I1_HELAN